MLTQNGLRSTLQGTQTQPPQLKNESVVLPGAALQISLSVWSLLNLLGRVVLSTNCSAPTIKLRMARLKVQLELLKVDWEGCLVEHWKQIFHGSYSPTGQHPIPQLKSHLMKSKLQIWTGWDHLLSLYSIAKSIRNTIMTEPLGRRCFPKAKRFLPRTLTVATNDWLGIFWRVVMPYLSW